MITKKFRFITLALIFSGALNIGLITAFAFFMYQEPPAAPGVAKSSKKEIQTTNGQLIGSMSRLSFRELVSFLTNRDLVEEGYTKRDLAIASLVAYHHFNIERALAGAPSQVRTLTLAGDQKIDVFPGLSEDQFEAIIRFAYQEKWPLTAKGLFSHLQARQNPRDESLEQAFLLTPEFYAMQVLFQKTDAPQESTILLNLISEGSWDLLEKFTHDQSQILDFSPEKRRILLLSYLSLHSPTAAQLLLKTDFVFALKRLEDRGILDLLALLKKQTEEGTKFCTELLRSPPQRRDFTSCSDDALCLCRRDARSAHRSKSSFGPFCARITQGGDCAARTNTDPTSRSFSFSYRERRGEPLEDFSSVQGEGR